MNCDYKFGNQFYKYFDDVGFKTVQYNIIAPEQEQTKQPGEETLMYPRPIFDNPNYKGSEW